MDLYTFLYVGAQVFTSFFIIGVVSIILDEMDDDDDDQDGGILQPVYVRVK